MQIQSYTEETLSPLLALCSFASVLVLASVQVGRPFVFAFLYQFIAFVDICPTITAFTVCLIFSNSVIQLVNHLCSAIQLI